MNCDSTIVVDYNNEEVSQSVLFVISQQYAEQGRRVLFLSPRPLSELPLSIYNETSDIDPQVLQLIRFSYPANYERLEDILGSLKRPMHPISVIIIEHLDHFLEMAPDADSLVDWIFQIADQNATLTGDRGLVAASFDATKGPEFAKSLVPFKNAWTCRKDSNNRVKLKRADPTPQEIFSFDFEIDVSNRRLIFENVLMTLKRYNKPLAE